MSDRWDSLRAKYQGKNIDLDAEFEKFLNESLSDESLVSPRQKTPLKTKLSKETDAGSLPWWAEEDEEGEKKKEALRQSWLKPKTKEDVDKENRDGNEKAEKLQTTHPIPVDTGISQASNHGNSTAVSISKDSLEEVAGRKSLQKEKLAPKTEYMCDIPERLLSAQDDTGTHAYSDDAETGNSSVSPSHVMTPSKNPAVGVNTLQKEEDKLKFFQEQLRDDSQFEFYKEVEEMSTTESVSPDKERDHRLQATGAEVGDSIFNVSDNQTEEAKNSGDGDDDDAHEYRVDPDDDCSAQFEDTHENPDEEDTIKDELYKPLQPTSEAPDQKKPSLLSKVSLMDSLDSTLDRKRSKQTQFIEKTKAMEGTSISGSGLKATGTGNLNSSATDTITELRAALQQIQMNATDRSQQGSQPLDTQSEDQLVLQKTSSGETKSRGFSLRPSVITDSRPVENDLKKRQLLTNITSAGITISSDSIDSASLPVDCGGFSLKASIPVLERTEPGMAVDSQGIPLDSRVVPLDSRESQDSVTEEKRGLDLQPVANLLAVIEKEGRKNDDDDNHESTSSPDSLRSIKAKVKAQKSVGAMKSDRAKKPTSKKATKTASSPVRVRGSKGSLPASSSGVPQKKGKLKEKENSNSIGKSRIDQWQPSVSSPPSWSPTPSLRKSKHTEGKIPREQRLQSEVENWQRAWKDERRRNDKLITDFAACERELSRKKEKTRLCYEEQIHELKQEIYSLQARLQEEQEDADNRKKVASGGDLKGITEEEKKRLEKEIREQEKLMKGYQQENERLYKELKQIQAKAKATEGRMFAENQKLATEVANLKERLDNKTGQSHYLTPGSPVLGADRINYLQDQLGSYKKRETETQKEVDELRQMNMSLEQRVRAAERERDGAVERANQALGTSTREQSEMKIRFESEIERLNRKLKWYAENQEILDRDLIKIKEKDQEIKHLKETVQRLKKQQGTEFKERRERANEKASDAKRIRDLERQVREMEEIIKRRYPNSLPALILAASSTPGVAQAGTNESSIKQSPSYLFLEHQVKKLESQLEEKDDETSRRIRAIEQKYNAMKFDYEERIKELEENLKRANGKGRPSTHPHTHAQALEKELAVVHEADRRRINKLESEIGVLQEALSRMSSLQAHAKNMKRNSDDKRPTTDVDQDTSEKLRALARRVQEKDKEITELKQTCSKLQQERETMLASAHRDTRTTSKSPHVAELERQNNQLKQRVAQMSLDIDQDRIRYQASLAEAERSARQARDDAAEQVEKLRAQHQSELNQVKREFAVRHSNSVVTELKSKLATKEIMIQKLREKVISEARNTEYLAAAKTREEVYKQQITNLQNELLKAKENVTPEMKHFETLQSKITAMEQRFNQRETDLERIINTTRIKSKLEKEESDSRWKAIVRKKKQEIEEFREELDVILEALRELKRQGVVIPVMVANHY